MNKKYHKGLVIGKFYPFHHGHQFLIETALKNSEHLTVILCQTDRYKIPPEIRAAWIKKTFPGLEVKILHHDTALDSNSTAMSKIWARLTVKFLGYSPDAVFTSENYGDPYASFMGAKHVLVDLARKKVPISATKIRSNIGRYWDFLPPSTQNYYVQKVVVLGAESTGTTTLAKDLAAHYQTVWAPEYGRLYYEGQMSASNSDAWRTDEFVHIAKAQNRLEEALVKKTNHGLLICDTDAFATTLWHERYLGKSSRRVEQSVKKEKPLLYILTDIDIPFVQDGTRDGEHLRTWMHQRFLVKLKQKKLNYFIASGTRKQRLAFCIKKINQILNSPLS
jgi:NadR type nicotinamide-nucleotide adenylyltransferase